VSEKSRFEFIVFAEFFSRDHDGDGGFGDEVVGEGAEDYTVMGGFS